MLRRSASTWPGNEVSETHIERCGKTGMRCQPSCIAIAAAGNVAAFIRQGDQCSPLLKTYPLSPLSAKLYSKLFVL